MVLTLGSVFYEIKNSYKPLVAIMLGVAAFQISITLNPDFFESYFVPHMLIIILPLGVSVYSFVVSKLYGGSKIFGRSYFALGMAYFAVFLTEIFYVYFFDILNQDVPVIADYFLLSFYPLVLIHLAINIRYFSQKLSVLQKITFGIVPGILTILYALLVFGNSASDFSYFYYSLIFVIFSSLQIGFVLVGFSLFRQTVLFSTWLLLLVGIFIGTIGDMVYHYGEIFDDSWIENVTAIWVASNLTMIYALYKHQKSI